MAMKMSADRRSYARRIAMPLSVVVLVGVLLISWDRCWKARAGGQAATTKVQSHDVVSEMVGYVEQGRYDDAVQIGLRSLQGGPSDETIYQQIADIYLIRAHKDPDKREQWVAKAASYTDKALSLNSKDRDVAGVHLFQDARAFEMAGDLSALARCGYYERAKKLLEDRVPLLQGDEISLEGKVFPLAPLRKENEKVLEDVKAKAANAGCKK